MNMRWVDGRHERERKFKFSWEGPAAPLRVVMKSVGLGFSSVTSELYDLCH